MFRKQRAQHQNGGAHRFHEFIGRVKVSDCAAVYLNIELLIDDWLHAHAAQQLEHCRDIKKMGQIAYGDFV